MLNRPCDRSVTRRVGLPRDYRAPECALKEACESQASGRASLHALQFCQNQSGRSLLTCNGSRSQRPSVDHRGKCSFNQLSIRAKNKCRVMNSLEDSYQQAIYTLFGLSENEESNTSEKNGIAAAGFRIRSSQLLPRDRGSYSPVTVALLPLPAWRGAGARLNGIDCRSIAVCTHRRGFESLPLHCPLLPSCIKVAMQQCSIVYNALQYTTSSVYAKSHCAAFCSSSLYHLASYTAQSTFNEHA